jgi:TonB-dependent SusC/RagA subfamily outer membrane receptor
MVKLLIVTLLILVTNISFAHSNLPGKSVPYIFDTVPVKLDAGTKAIDSNILIVLDDKVLGTIREIKDLSNIISPDSIKSINILKDTAAFTRYGAKGKNGVIEIYTKKALKSQVNELYLEEIKEDDNKVFEKVEVEASFKGGEREWRKYLERNLDPNVPVKNGCKPGEYTVVIQFIVDKEGSVSDVRALTNHGFGMEEEAMRIIKKGPDWVPAIQNGRQVKAYRKQRFSFVVLF